MSSSRPSDAGVDRPDPADLPDADGAPTPDLGSESVGFTRRRPDERRTPARRPYAVPPRSRRRDAGRGRLGR